MKRYIENKICQIYLYAAHNTHIWNNWLKKADRATGAVIQKLDVIIDYIVKMGGVDLVSLVLFPYCSQMRSIVVQENYWIIPW